MSRDKLAAMLEKNDQKGCIAFFAKMPEDERRSYAEQAAAWYKFVDKTPMVETGPGSSRLNPLYSAAGAAAFACCSFSQLQKLGRGFTPAGDVAFEILKTRRPQWIDDWACWILETIPYRWTEIRRLMGEGLCRKPATEHYTLGMIVGLCNFANAKQSIYDALLADPELLQDDIWRLFEVEGSGELTLAARDKYSRGDNSWTYAFLRLSQEKKLSRERLLDASLAALKRDFSQFRAGWFSQFHEALEPTVEERASRIGDYLELLGSRIPPTVSFALKALQTLEKADKLEPQAFVGAIAPALWNKHKGTVRAALQLVEKTVRKHPGVRGQVGTIAAGALDHESPDVQKAALDFLGKHCQPLSAELTVALRERLPGLSPSQRPRLQKLLAEAPDAPAAHEPNLSHKTPAQDVKKDLKKRAATLPKHLRAAVQLDPLIAALDGGRIDVPAIDFDFLTIPRLDPALRLSPVATLDELIDAYVRVLENPGDPMDVERVLDGVSRLCDQRPDDFAARTGPVRKRALDRLGRMFSGPFIGCGALPDLCGVARAWLCGEVVFPERTGTATGEPTLHLYRYATAKRETEFFVYHKPTPRTFLSMRALDVARRSAVGEAAPLLAAPTHAGGWIDPGTLVRRALDLDATKRDADPLDRIQALLRLAPDRREAARKAAQKVAGEFGCALRYALGGDEKIGADAALWTAAARARQPSSDDDRLERKHPGLGPDAATVARHRVELRKRYGIDRLSIAVDPAATTAPSVERITVLMNPHPNQRGERDNMEVRGDVADIRWMATIWPARRESWFARAAGAFADNLDWGEAQWENRAFLEPLLDPDVPLEPMARLMLALGLAAKDADESGLTTDALIAAIDDGRLDAAGLGATLAVVHQTGQIKLARWARTLSLAMRVSPLHRHVILHALPALLTGDPRKPPKDLHAVLDVLKEGLIEHGDALDDPAARSFLEKAPATGKTGRLIRELLASSKYPDSAEAREALLRAIDRRLERAEAWAKRIEHR